MPLLAELGSHQGARAVINMALLTELKTPATFSRKQFRNQ
jgi:hypothetical protein